MKRRQYQMSLCKYVCGHSLATSYVSYRMDITAVLRSCSLFVFRFPSLLAGPRLALQENLVVILEGGRGAAAACHRSFISSAINRERKPNRWRLVDDTVIEGCVAIRHHLRR